MSNAGTGRHRGALDQLTSLRFLAACAVLLSHLTFLGNQPGSVAARLYGGLFSEGFAGVTFFYVLSGFIIAYAYGDALLDGAIDRRHFLLRRAARIFPLHWITAAAVALYLLFVRHEPPPAGRLILNLGLLHAWAPQPTLHYSLNGPSWSLSCEIFFYAMFPLLIALRASTLARLAAGMAAFIAGAAFYASRHSAGFSPTLEWFFYVAPATRLLDFMIGILVFHIWRSRRLAMLGGTAAEIGILLLLPGLAWILVAADVPLPWRWQLAYLPAMACAVLVFAHGRGFLSRLMRRRLPVQLGEASFALYLTHRPIILAAEGVAARIAWVPPLLLAAGLAVACIAVSLLVWRWFDLPVQRRLRGRRAPMPTIGRRSRAPARPAFLAAVLLASCATVALWLHHQPSPAAPAPATVRPTTTGINLTGIATYNRQPVFANMIAQSEWFSDTGKGWSALPAGQIDARGWVRRLEPGQVAPRPLALPPVPIGRVSVRCTWTGSGAISGGGIARFVAEGPGRLDLVLISSGGSEDGAWIQLDRTDPADPVRNIDCRDEALPRDATFHPEFLSFLRGFAGLRFLDWQRANDNLPVRWATRTTPDSGSQLAGPDGVAIEHMIALANEVDADPWFIMPYNSDATYVAGFARLVHDRLEPARTVYVEFGNEMWNDMFAATMQARKDGLAMGLDRDPVRAQTRRYAQRSAQVMQIWTRAFADRPRRLVRVLGGLNAYPDLFRDALDYQDTAKWIDALATAPYIHFDLGGRRPGDEDAVFGGLDEAVRETLRSASQNKAIADRYGKRFIAYEGGQHLVTKDLDLARALQRNPRMAAVYSAYLRGWKTDIGDRMMLYASTAPIGEWGAWGLREYAGQPIAETPKLRAVRSFLAAGR